IQRLVGDGRFREDLYYRLHVFQIEVPALRERREDIIPLAELFLEEEMGTGVPVRFSRDVQMSLERHGWPGNVRELRNVCRYLAARAWGKSLIELNDLPTSVWSCRHPAGLDVRGSRFEQEKRALERAQLEEALREGRGRIRTAARLLGMSRNTVSRRMRAYGLKRESFME
ncbi:MAG: helix-turn-helix domain-containing protein, partial [Candidatus Krumholzibacteriia bacterium]